MEIQQQRQEEYYDKGVTGKTYAVNEFVFLHNPAVGGGYSKKFHKPWQGPFKVVEVLGPSVYRIADCVNPQRQKVAEDYPWAGHPHQDSQQILWIHSLME